MTTPVDADASDAARARDDDDDAIADASDARAKRAKTTPATTETASVDVPTAAAVPETPPTTTPPTTTATDARAPSVDDVVAGSAGGTVVAQGVPGGWDQRAFASWLDARGVRRSSEKKRHKWPYGFVVFGTMEDRILGTKAMEACEFNGRCVRVKQATAKGKTARDGGLVSAEGTSAAALIEAANANARRDIRDVITPLWKVSYGEQLAMKRETVAEALRCVTRGVRNACVKAKKSGRRAECEWLRAALGNDKLCCEMEGIVRSPVLNGYRNKSEFTIGPGADGEPTCGFNVGSFRDGLTAVAPPVGCRNISDTAKRLGDAVQTYLRARKAEGKGLPVYDKRDATGFWRLFVCREGGMAPSSELGWRDWLRPGAGPPKAPEGSAEEAEAEKEEIPFEYPDEEFSLPAPTTMGEKSEVLVMLQVRRAEYTEEQIKEECDGVCAALDDSARTATPPINIKVRLVQFYDGTSNVAPDDAEIRNIQTNAPSEKSMDVIHEQMCGLDFSLSATAFFQVNTPAAEALYRLAGEWASPNGKSLLLDVCCGTGTIGLTLARDTKKVVGVDIVAESIKDAFVNAKLNGVDNTDWQAGKAEQLIPKILNDYKNLIKPSQTVAKKVAPLNDEDFSGDEAPEVVAQSEEPEGKEYEFDDVVAIVDPPRGGLHRNVLTALRRENRLKRLVYVSCNATTMANNVIELCVPQGLDGNGGGVPFKPVKALALDLFPHTKHVEAILLLER